MRKIIICFSLALMCNWAWGIPTVKELREKILFSESAANQPAIELIHDLDNEVEKLYLKNATKTITYTKLPYKVQSIKAWNESPVISSSTRVLSLGVIKSLSKEAIDLLLGFVSDGGLLLLPQGFEDPQLLFLAGLKANASYEFNNIAKGFHFDHELLPGVQGINSNITDRHFGLSRENFTEEILVLASATTDSDFPSITENSVGLGTVILINSYIELGKLERGLLFSLMLKGLEGIPYPIANVSTIFLDDFPSPLYVGLKEEPVKSEMDIDQADFVSKVWWPDMQRLADDFDITYTALPAFNYNNTISPPFDFREWDNGKFILDGKKQIGSNWLTRNVSKSRHELGFHGYNHVSLWMKDWKNPDFMKLALLSVKKKWLVNGFGALPVTYVPPTNWIDQEGLIQLQKGLPSIKYLSSVYVGVFSEGGDREFGPDPIAPKLFDYPRITSGYVLSEKQIFDQQSLYIFTGIWTHFIHPDDVYQLPTTDNETDGGFRSRNHLSLGWKETESRADKKGMFELFEDYLEKTRAKFPMIRFVSVEQGAEKTKVWLDTEYSFDQKKDDISAYAQHPLNSNENEYYWFMFSSKSEIEQIENELTQAKSEFYSTSLHGGRLYSIKTSVPRLSLKKITNTKSTQTAIRREVKRKNQNFYDRLNDNEPNIESVGEQVETLTLSPATDAPSQVWVEFYIAENQVDKAIDLLAKDFMGDYTWDDEKWKSYTQYTSWQGRGDEAWTLLELRWKNNPNEQTLKLAKSLKLEYGASNSDLEKLWLERQLRLEPHNAGLMELYVQNYSTPENFEKISPILRELAFNINPSARSQTKYIQHLLWYDTEAVIETTATMRPANIQSLATELVWVHADKKLYRKALAWAALSSEIPMLFKMQWWTEIGELDIIMSIYPDYLALNPHDDSTRLFVANTLLDNEEIKSAWELAYRSDGSIKKDSLKSRLNQAVRYDDSRMQKDLLMAYESLFEPSVKAEILKKLRIEEGAIVDFTSQLETDNFKNNVLLNGLSLSIAKQHGNEHEILGWSGQVQSDPSTLEQPNDQRKFDLFGLRYRYSSILTAKDAQWWISGGVQSGDNKEILYDLDIGFTRSKERKYQSLQLTYNPVYTSGSLNDGIYQGAISLYQEYKNESEKIEGSLLTAFNYYTNSVISYSATARLLPFIQKSGKNLFYPLLEGSYLGSDTDQSDGSPFWVVEEFWYAGIGFGWRHNGLIDKLNFNAELGGFYDNTAGIFGRFTGEASYQIRDFTHLKLRVEYNGQSLYSSQFIQLGIRHYIGKKRYK